MGLGPKNPALKRLGVSPRGTSAACTWSFERRRSHNYSRFSRCSVCVSAWARGRRPLACPYPRSGSSD